MSRAVASYKGRGEAIRRSADEVRAKALKIVGAAIEGASKHPAQVAADARLPKAEAPMYLHMATQIGAETMRKEADEKKDAGTTLNVMIMGQAPSTEAWLEAVKRSQAVDVLPIPATLAIKAPTDVS